MTAPPACKLALTVAEVTGLTPLTVTRQGLYVNTDPTYPLHSRVVRGELLFTVEEEQGSKTVEIRANFQKIINLRQVHMMYNNLRVIKIGMSASIPLNST